MVGLAKREEGAAAAGGRRQRTHAAVRQPAGAAKPCTVHAAGAAVPTGRCCQRSCSCTAGVSGGVAAARRRRCRRCGGGSIPACCCSARMVDGSRRAGCHCLRMVGRWGCRRVGRRACRRLCKRRQRRARARSGAFGFGGVRLPAIAAEMQGHGAGLPDGLWLLLLLGRHKRHAGEAAAEDGDDLLGRALRLVAREAAAAGVGRAARAGREGGLTPAAAAHLLPCTGRHAVLHVYSAAVGRRVGRGLGVWWGGYWRARCCVRSLSNARHGWGSRDLTLQRTRSGYVEASQAVAEHIVEDTGRRRHTLIH